MNTNSSGCVFVSVGDDSGNEFTYFSQQQLILCTPLAIHSQINITAEWLARQQQHHHHDLKLTNALVVALRVQWAVTAERQNSRKVANCANYISTLTAGVLCSSYQHAAFVHNADNNDDDAFRCGITATSSR